MTRLALSFFLLFILGSVAVRALPRDQFYNIRGARTTVNVQDKETGEPLIGATVTIVSGADTLRGATRKSTNSYAIEAEYTCDRIFRDSVWLEVGYLGYKPFTKRYAPGEFRYIHVELEIDEQQIAQVVVTGRSIAMIFRGDTTVYNASAYKTMADDRLSELLKQLPGVEIKDNKIYADGEEVKRVYVDGRNLFGQQTSASLTDLKADDVKNVRVYEELSPEARHTDDRTARKEKVMDVETKSRRGVLWGGEVQAMAGASLEKDYSGRHEVRHAEKLRIFRHSEKGSTSLEAANTKDDTPRENASLASKTTPSKRTEATFSHEFRHGDTTSVGVVALFNRNRNSSVGSTLTDYFPTDEYALRRDESRRESLSKRISADLHTSARIQRRKNSFNANWSVQYGDGASSGRNTTDQQLDAGRTFTRILSDGSDRSFGTDLSLYYSFRLSEKSRMNMRISFNYADRKSNDWQVDTVASVPGLRMQLHNGGKGRTFSGSAAVGYSYATGEKSRLEVGYEYSQRYEESERLSMDFLHDPRGRLDSVNTYDYTIDYHTHRLTASWSYSSEKVSCYAYLWGSMYDLARNETFPRDERSPRRFYALTPNVMLLVGKARNRLQVSVGARPEAPSAEQLRSTLDATNPLLLRAGNPDLKLPTSVQGSLRYYNTDASAARSLSVSLSGGYDFNYVTTQDRFFLEETYLPEWDYTAQKGAQLLTETNVGGSYRVGADFGYSKQIASIRSTVRLGVSYDFRQTPFYSNGQLDRPGNHSLSFTAGFESGFSEKVKFSVRSATGMSSYDTRRQTTRQLTQTVNGRLDLRFGKYFGFVGTLYRFYCSSVSKALTRHDVVLNAAVGRKFGKENAFSLSVGVVDVLNRPEYATTKIEANYIRTSSTSYLGRFAYMQAGYTF